MASIPGLPPPPPGFPAEPVPPAPPPPRDRRVPEDEPPPVGASDGVGA